MTQYNKIVVASEMFVEAHGRYVSGARDIDYIASLVLSGAVCSIVSRLLQQQGDGTFHTVLASLFEQATDEGVLRSIYDGFTQAVYKRTETLQPADIIIRADLRKEAAWMLEAAREDFSKIIIERGALDELSSDFLKLIREPVDYVEGD